MAKTSYGKLAATLHHPAKGSVRFSLQPAFIDAMGQFEFFVPRKTGLEHSQIPAPVWEEILKGTYEQPDDAVFKVEPKPDFKFTPVRVRSTSPNAAFAGNTCLIATSG